MNKPYVSLLLHELEVLLELFGFRQYWSNSKSLYSKTCIKQPLKKNTKMVFNTNYRLMQVKSIAECSKGSTLQYFRPSICYYFPLSPLICLFLSGRLRQVLL